MFYFICKKNLLRVYLINGQDGRSRKEIKNRTERKKRAFLQKGCVFKACMDLKVKL